MGIRGIFWISMLVIGGIVAAVHAHQVDAAKSEIGSPVTSQIEYVAKATVDEFYRDGGWGDMACAAYNRHHIAPTKETETVWDDALENAYDDHPQHEYRHSLGEHPSLATLAASC